MNTRPITNLPHDRTTACLIKGPRRIATFLLPLSLLRFKGCGAAEDVDLSFDPDSCISENGPALDTIRVAVPMGTAK